MVESAGQYRSFLADFMRQQPLLFVAVLSSTCLLAGIITLSMLLGASQLDWSFSDAPPAELTFVSFCDMAEWIEDAPDLRWGLAMSKGNMTRVLMRDGKGYNQPATDFGSVNRALVAGGMKTGEKRRLTFEPGIYDWLIVLDADNNGYYESYLGTLDEQITLDAMNFAAGTTYEVVVAEDSITVLTISPAE